MDGIKQWIEAEGTGHWFFVAFPVILLCLFIWFKGRRVCFLIPSLLITIVIVNPVFYKIWDQMGLYAYWRILWIIPVIPIVAALVPSITEKLPKVWNKGIIISIGIGLILIGGTFLYNGQGGTFVRADNAAKLPKEVVEIAEKLEELDDHPRIITETSIGTYIRQYSGTIDSMFGRDIFGHITNPSVEAINTCNAMNTGDWNAVNKTVINDRYGYLITKQSTAEGFELVDCVNGYGIYKAIGAPSIIKEWNELGWVTRATFVDENGQPINGPDGYSTVRYEYDNNGQVIREFRTNIYGLGVTDADGHAGFEREYDQFRHMIMERYLGSDGYPVVNSLGYAEYRREYHGSEIIKEAFYNEKGELVKRKDTGYAIITIKNDLNGRRISECYFAKENEPVLVAGGYSSFKKSYDSQGRITSTVYYGTDGNLINCINGYSKEERVYDKDGNELIRRYFDSNEKPVVSANGYAEIRRTYSNNHLIREEYIGADGQTLEQPGGYIAFVQEWEEDSIRSRTYLGLDSQPIKRTDGYSKVLWTLDENGVWNASFLALDGTRVNNDGFNLVRDLRIGEDGWSEWMIPQFNSVNSSFNIGCMNLGEKYEGDMYTCQIEIEFRGVTKTEGEPFLFQTQGEVDNHWKVGNIWYPNIVHMESAPNDGVYHFVSTVALNESKARSNEFSIGFRCDNWASGMFRVRKVKVEKGNNATQWSPGP